MQWKGVMPAMTTGLDRKLDIDHKFVAKHAKWMVDAGCTGIVTPGSLGEGNTLRFEEKVALWKTVVEAVGGRVPVVAAIAALSTVEAVDLAKAAAEAGCEGLMVLPQYVYKGDWRENKAHVAAVFKATKLSCMLYNNPAAYGVDYLIEHIAQLADAHANLCAVKDSTGDARRLTAIRARFGTRISALVGLDDCAVEGARMGACGWIAGLANALPVESVQLWNLAQHGPRESCDALYAWFLPLLRLDTVPNFVQLIKLVMQENHTGTETVRLPRLPLEGTDRACAISLIRHALAHRPA